MVVCYNFARFIYKKSKIDNKLQTTFMSTVPVWSSVNIAGVRLKDINPQIGTERDPESWSEVHEEVMKSADKVRQLKGNSSWAVALAVSDLCRAIFTNKNTVIPVSTHVNRKLITLGHNFFLTVCIRLQYFCLRWRREFSVMHIKTEPCHAVWPMKYVCWKTANYRQHFQKLKYHLIQLYI